MPPSSRDSLRRFVAGAVAEAAIHDLRVNLFAYSGFPQIDVACGSDDEFHITLSWETYQSSFVLTDDDAKVATKTFRSAAGYERSIFDKVQSALADLDFKVSNLAPNLPISLATN
jgi:hypothetical protein